MRFFLFFFIVLALSVTFFVAVIYYIVRAILSIGISAAPDSKSWKATIGNMRRALDARMSTLVPWDGDMLALLSLNKIEQKKTGFLNAVETGVFGSIYQEPVVAYAQHRNKDTGALVARTTDREFVYRFKGRETEIWLNGQPLGVLVDGNLLAPGRGSRLLAQIENTGQESAFPVVLNNQTAGAVANVEKVRGSTPNPRAVSLIRPVSVEEESLMLALAIFQMSKE
jgi:hypothetical protein